MAATVTTSRRRAHVVLLGCIEFPSHLAPPRGRCQVGRVHDKRNQVARQPKLLSDVTWTFRQEYVQRMSQPPSQSRRGVRWLANFPLSDRACAARLLDAMRFVGSVEFRTNMDLLVRRAIEDLGTSDVSTLVLGEPRRHVNYFSEPADLHRSGSDGTVLEITERAARYAGAKYELNLDQMRTHQIHNLLVVTDNIGSGDQVLRILDFIRRNRTVRSWISNGWLRFHVLAYAITLGGLERLQRDRRISSVRFVESSRGLDSAYWSDAELRKVVSLCHTYAHKKSEALGRDGAFALTVFAHSIPNNVPAVVLQRHGPSGTSWVRFARGERWAGLSATQLKSLDSYRPPASFVSMAAHLKQP